MNSLDPNRTLESAAQGLATDARSLDSLRRAAQRDPRAALKGAAQQFEALFLQMVLKSMRDATPRAGLLDSDSADTYTGMLDQQLANRMAGASTGLAAVIEKQLARYVGDGKAAHDGVPPAAARRAALDRYQEMAGAARQDGRADGTAPDAAADATGSEASIAGLGPAQRDFIVRMREHALAVQRTTGIPAHFVLAQAALESGWGRQEMRDPSGAPVHNLFGVKAGAGWRGRTVDVVTTEFADGVARKVVQKFRAYDGYAEAFQDWAQLMTGSRRYVHAVASALTDGSGAGFAQGLARAGYATDPDYGAKLARVIDTLTGQRDRVATHEPPHEPRST